MRTWMLAPDGVWTEVTQHVAQYGDNPDGWHWGVLLAQISPDYTPKVGDALMFPRGAAPAASHQLSDTWLINRIWGAFGDPAITAVSLLRLMHSGDHRPWLQALTKWSSRPDDKPHYHWAPRRAYWLLLAHSTVEAGTPAIDGARIVIGVR